MNNPLISVVTVVYNGVATLEQTMLSVINQTYKNIEYIIIDGGSTDGTIDIIKKYENHLAYWVSEPDKGIYDAMNKGINRAKGDLIGIINSDDWYENGTINIIANYYGQYPDIGIFHGDMFVVYENNKKILKKGTVANIKWKMDMNHPTCFVKRSLYCERLYPFNIRYKLAADYDFLLWCYLNNYKFMHIDKVLVFFRIGGFSDSSPTSIDAYYIWKNNFGRLHASFLYSKDTIIKLVKAIVKYMIKHVIGEKNLVLLKYKIKSFI
jgi:glycosyltransferase involved in cell wall biosynthesis